MYQIHGLVHYPIERIFLFNSNSSLHYAKFIQYLIIQMELNFYKINIMGRGFDHSVVHQTPTHSHNSEETHLIQERSPIVAE
jgi:hypothetical protein